MSFFITCRQHNQTTRTWQKRPPQTTLKDYVHGWKIWKMNLCLSLTYVAFLSFPIYIYYTYIYMNVCNFVYILYNKLTYVWTSTAFILFLSTFAHCTYVRYVCNSQYVKKLKGHPTRWALRETKPSFHTNKMEAPL